MMHTLVRFFVATAVVATSTLLTACNPTSCPPGQAKDASNACSDTVVKQFADCAKSTGSQQLSADKSNEFKASVEYAGIGVTALADFKDKLDQHYTASADTCVQRNIVEACYAIANKSPRKEIPCPVSSGPGTRLPEPSPIEACETGSNSEICFAIAMSYAPMMAGPDGRGVPSPNADIQQHEHFLNKACLLRHNQGCYALGANLIMGRGVRARDATRGELLMAQACDNGLAMSCFFLALYSQEGVGLKKDLEKSSKYRQKACVLGEADACGNALLPLLGPWAPDLPRPDQGS